MKCLSKSKQSENTWKNTVEVWWAINKKVIFLDFVILVPSVGFLKFII